LFEFCAGDYRQNSRRFNGIMSQTTCKPGSVQTLRPGTAIHLGRALLRTSRDQPGRRDGNVPCVCRRGFTRIGPPAAPIRSCSRWGLPCRLRCRKRGALLPHHFTLAVPWCPMRRRYVFCGTFPGVAPAGGWPAPHSRGARTFLRRGFPPGGGHPVVWRGGDARDGGRSQLRDRSRAGRRHARNASVTVEFASDPVLFCIAARLHGR